MEGDDPLTEQIGAGLNLIIPRDVAGGINCLQMDMTGQGSGIGVSLHL
jgi:hypothetical protein